MKLLLLVFVFLAAAAPASAAERFKGKLLYRGDNEVWMPAPGVGYKNSKAAGTSPLRLARSQRSCR